MTNNPLLSSADLLATECRVAVRLLIETVKGLRRSGWMNAVIIVTLASILTIFGSFAVIILNLQQLIRSVGAGVEISVYVDPPKYSPMFTTSENQGRETRQLKQLEAQILKLPAVQDVHLESRQASWASMRNQYDAIDIDNPLPNTLHVKVIDQALIDATAETLERMPGVVKVNYAKTVVNKLKDVTRIVTGVGGSLTLILAILTMFIISNTIHLLIEARTREIEILRMMGVGNWYIRLPFFFQGGAYGFCAVMIALLPLSVVQHYCGQLFGYFQAESASSPLTLVTTLMLLVSLGVGVGGAAVSTHRFLKV
ncbi:MAG: permease-like cell division protein FtsX [Vampirovibrionales bacterium]|nr:permease-like cell division protein FtsX [Vampirovibrionales bacterium]